MPDSHQVFSTTLPTPFYVRNDSNIFSLPAELFSSDQYRQLASTRIARAIQNSPLRPNKLRFVDQQMQRGLCRKVFSSALHPELDQCITDHPGLTYRSC